jgi:hypothetical protein
MRFCFTIRDLLWLTFVVALAAGWWVDHNKPPRYEVIKTPNGKFFIDRDAQTKTIMAEG